MDHSILKAFEGYSVFFRNLKEAYTINQSNTAKIECCFSTKDDINLSTFDSDNCFIGLFHVGWDTLGSCISKENFSSVKQHQKQGLFCVNFEISHIQIDEFYQFCSFNIKTEIVYGASSPFLICNSEQTESFIHIDSKDKSFDSKESEWFVQSPVDEDVDDSVLVHTKTTMLEDTLAKKLKENDQLKIIKKKLELEIKQAAAERLNFEKKTKEEINVLLDKLYLVEKEELLLKQSLADTDVVIERLTNKLANISKEFQEDYDKKLAKERNALDAISENYNSLTKEKEILLQNLNETIRDNEKMSELLMKTEKGLQEKTQECEDLKSQVLSEKNQNESLEVSYQEMVASLTSQIETLAKDQSVFCDLQGKYNDVDYKLMCEKKINHELLSKNETLSETVTKLQKKVEENCSTFLSEKSRLLQQLDDYSEVASVHEDEKVLLNAELAAIPALQEELDKKNSCIQESDELIKKMKVQLSDVEIIMKARQDEATGIIVELKKDNDKMKTELKNLSVVKCDSENSLNSLSSVSELSSIDLGSRNALQVVNLHLQKQVKNLKKEISTYQNQQKPTIVSDNISELKKINEDLKLRLCMGKSAYEESYRECQKLKAQLMKYERGSIQVGEIKVCEKESKWLSEVEQLQKKNIQLQKEINDGKEHEQILFQETQDLIEKSKKLVCHYEGQLQLLEEENQMIRKNYAIPLQADICNVLPKDHVVKKRSETRNEIICVPPSTKEPVVPDVILYPPSFQHLPESVFKKETALVSKSDEPVSQVIQNRVVTKSKPVVNTSSANVVEQDKVKSKVKYNQHSFSCPVCGMDFPESFSDKKATEHVNTHFV